MQTDDEDDPLGMDLFNGDSPSLNGSRSRLPKRDGVSIALSIILGAIIIVALLGLLWGRIR